MKDIKTILYKILSEDLSQCLYYHNIGHTIDVHEVCKFYIKYYDISPSRAHLLEIAAVGHDIGFTQTYHDHEVLSREITLDLMDQYGYSEEDKQLVGQMILATKIPQSPSCFLSKVLCDADLDYLGRRDFISIGQQLKEEWLHYNILKDAAQFDGIQIGFLEKHSYHTDYAIRFRRPEKKKHLDRLMSKAV